MDKEYTLGDILGEALYGPKVPRMTYLSGNVSTQVRIEFIGRNKIQAIRAVRDIFGLSLRAAKDLIEWPGGFVVSPRLFQIIKNEYMNNPPPGAEVLDWREIKTRPEPIYMLNGAP